MVSTYRNKTVVITGACGGMGRALSLRFGQAGARIAMIDLNSEQLDTFKAHLEQKNIQAKGYVCDITKNAQVHDTFSKILADFTSVDLLVNNAGITHRSAFSETDIQVFHRVMQVNYFGAVHCTKAAMPALCQSKGQVITMSSMSGFTPLYHRSAYSASKHALHGLFDDLRLELEPRDVNVMLVCPGFTATDIRRNALEGDGSIVNEPLRLVGSATPASQVAEEIFKASLKRRHLLLVSNVNWRARILARFFPRFFGHYVAGHLSGVHLDPE
ncbi:SDR family oxidoreductase [Spongorhabdus nitratireducens]